MSNYTDVELDENLMVSDIEKLLREELLFDFDMGITNEDNGKPICMIHPFSNPIDPSGGTKGIIINFCSFGEEINKLATIQLDIDSIEKIRDQVRSEVRNGIMWFDIEKEFSDTDKTDNAGKDESGTE